MTAVYRIAADLRPTILGAIVLLAIAATPWRVHHRSQPRWQCGTAVLHGSSSTPMTIEVPDAGAMPNAWTAGHPDARPWPQGMVINPGPHPDSMTLWRGSPLDRVLSLLVEPLLDLVGAAESPASGSGAAPTPGSAAAHSTAT